MSPFPRGPFRAIRRYTPDRRPVEIDLSDNTNRWGPHPAALQLIRAAAEEDLIRYPSVYSDGLRAAIARRFGISEDAIVTGCGSDDLLDSVFRAGADAGDRVSYVPPTFVMVEIFAHANGLEPRPVPTAVASDPEALLEGSPAVVYLCRPNNPTGEVAPRSWVERLLEAAGPGGPIVLLDEAYADFADDDFLKEAAASQRLVVLRTFSKAYGLAGLRVGFAVGPVEVVAEIEKARGPYKVGRTAEGAATAAIEDREAWVQGIVSMVRNERGQLVRELEARNLQPLPSGANFLLIPLRGRSASQVTARLRERGVAVRPFPELPGIGDAIRVTIGPSAEIARFLADLDEVLE
ncbi:MAG: histidinol-phosphate aminotransferase family protein [Gemmatimonadetes bacterium]|nr:histidinol-phosphate aminotransferase family protein [Gemmatimonadota bacterium]